LIKEALMRELLSQKYANTSVFPDAVESVGAVPPGNLNAFP
jgi:hypothetical protein